MSITSDKIADIYRSEQKRLERLATRKVGTSTAADVVQDVFTRIWERALDQVVVTPSFLSRCIQNASIDRLRAEKRFRDYQRNLTEEQYAAPVASPFDIAAARDDLRRLDAIIRALPERTRHIFLLNRVHGFTYEEISEALGYSRSMVEREMAKALLTCVAGVK
jgi:RNA polymerase sigma factor (sigma-70 family)